MSISNLMREVLERYVPTMELHSVLPCSMTFRPPGIVRSNASYRSLTGSRPSHSLFFYFTANRTQYHNHLIWRQVTCRWNANMQQTCLRRQFGDGHLPLYHSDHTVNIYGANKTKAWPGLAFA